MFSAPLWAITGIPLLTVDADASQGQRAEPPLSVSGGVAITAPAIDDRATASISAARAGNSSRHIDGKHQVGRTEFGETPASSLKRMLSGLTNLEELGETAQLTQYHALSKWTGPPLRRWESADEMATGWDAREDLTGPIGMETLEELAAVIKGWNRKLAEARQSLRSANVEALNESLARREDALLTHQLLSLESLAWKYSVLTRPCGETPLREALDAMIDAFGPQIAPSAPMVPVPHDMSPEEAVRLQELNVQMSITKGLEDWNHLLNTVIQGLATWRGSRVEPGPSAQAGDVEDATVLAAISQAKQGPTLEKIEFLRGILLATQAAEEEDDEEDRQGSPLAAGTPPQSPAGDRSAPQWPDHGSPEPASSPAPDSGPASTASPSPRSQSQGSLSARRQEVEQDA
jgi:hypothetical protein